MKKIFTVQGQDVRAEYHINEPRQLLWTTDREDGEYAHVEHFDTPELAHQAFLDTTYARAKVIFLVLEPTKTIAESSDLEP